MLVNGENKMKKKVAWISVALLVVLFVVFGITKGLDHKKEKDKKDAQTTVVWAIRGDAQIKEQNVKKTNALLQKKGYDLAIQFLELDVDEDYKKQEVYHNALKQAIEEGKVDLAYCDYIYYSESDNSESRLQKSAAPGEMEQYLESGLFMPLNEWLQSSAGKTVYDLYDEDVWTGASIHGKNYIFPDESADQASNGSVAFEKNHVSDALIDAWDGSWSGLWKSMQQIKLGNGEFMLLGNPYLDGFEEITKVKQYQMEDDLVYNIHTGEIQQPFALNEFHEYLKFLHQCYQKGYLNEENKIDSGEWNDEKELSVKNRGYAIAFQMSCNADDKRKENAFALTGMIGGGTAVVAGSKNREKALELVRILRTDDEIANTLIWGEGNKDRILDDDGYVQDSFKDMDNDKSLLGLNDGIFQSRDKAEPALDMREYRRQCEQSSLRTKSDILGFWADYSGLEDEINTYQNTLEKYVDCWQKDDFESEYKKADQQLAKVSEKLLQELNRQMTEWKKQKKSGH